MADKEKVIKGLKKLHGTSETMMLIVETITLLKEQEAVVRCKDCKHGDECVPPCKDRYCMIYDQRHNEDWYCADGERQTITDDWKKVIKG